MEPCLAQGSAGIQATRWPLLWGGAGQVPSHLILPPPEGSSGLPKPRTSTKSQQKSSTPIWNVPEAWATSLQALSWGPDSMNSTVAEWQGGLWLHRAGGGQRGWGGVTPGPCPWVRGVFLGGKGGARPVPPAETGPPPAEEQHTPPHPVSPAHGSRNCAFVFSA